MSSQQPSILNKRYLLHEKIGSGGMGVVLRATDRLTNETVAVKRVFSEAELEDSSQSSPNSPADTAALRVTLAHEFRTLAGLRHPYIISVLDYGFDEKRQPFFAMDYLADAKPLLAAAKDWSEEEKIEAVLKILHALNYLHRRGILHRDVKPANILISPDDTLKVLDFGLAVVRGRDVQQGEDAIGTFAYMAPEVLRGERASRASDLYSVGVIACELLGGKHPFAADTVPRLLTRVMSQEPDLPEVSPDLRKLLRRMLERDRKRRLATAGLVIEGISSASGVSVEDVSADVHELALQSPPFTGRKTEIAQLIGSFEQVMINKKGHAWLVGGESGVGKSRLLEELRTVSLVRGATVVRGQAAEDDSPYRLWRAALRWLSLIAEATDKEAALLNAFVPRMAEIMDRELPEAAIQPDSAQTQIMALTATLIRRIEEPLVILLEDLHAADKQSIELLAHVVTLIDDQPILVVGSYQDDVSPDLQSQLPRMKHLVLDRFTRESVATIIGALAGSAGRDKKLVDRLYKETEGNAYFLVETMRALAEDAGGIEQVAWHALPEQITAGGIERLIQRRLERIPESALPLLHMAALDGRQLQVNLLQHLAPEVDFDSWLVGCSDAAVIEIQDGTWQFTHEKLRSRLQAMIPEKERASVHRKLAEGIEALYGEDIRQAGSLARHWAAAGENDRVIHYAIQAGDHALASGVYAEVMPLLDDAVERLPKSKIAKKPDDARLRYLHARTHFGLSEYDQALSSFSESLAIYEKLEDAQGMSLAYLGLGDIMQARADYPQAADLYDKALEAAKQAKDPAAIATASYSRGRTEETKGDYDRALGMYREAMAIFEKEGDRLGIARVCSARGSARRKQGHYAESREDFEKCLTLYRELNNQHGIATGYNNLGVAAELEGDFRAALAYHRQSMDIKAEIGDRHGTGISLNNVGVAHFYLNELEEARAALTESAVIYAEVGDRQGIADCLNNIGLVEYLSGNYEKAAGDLNTCRDLCIELGDHWGVALAYLNLGKVRREQGQYDDARITLQLALQTAQEIGKTPVLLQTLVEYAPLLDDKVQAVTYLSLAATHSGTPGAEREDAGKRLKTLKEELPAEDFEKAAQEGKALDLDKTVSRLLKP